MSKEYFIQLPHNTYSSQQPMALPKIDHILGHKASLSKYKKKEIIPCLLSDHIALKLQLNHKNNNIKPASNWNVNNTLAK
jgi:endonuclease/exonuclease/phosphatase family metal-dependent hydrolase